MVDQIQLVQEFRRITKLGILDARNILKAANWDIELAVKNAQEKIGIMVDVRAHRETTEGVIESYIHVGSKIGVMVEVNCETDFVSRNETFKQFVRNICLQIAATNPLFISKADIPITTIKAEEDKWRSITEKQYSNAERPPAALARIVGGHMDRYYSSVCLLEQIYVKDTEKTVHQVLSDLIASLKENIRIKRFIRYQVGTN